MPVEPNSMIQLVQDLGFGMAALTFSGWLIIFLLRGFEKERNIWITKDTEADKALRELQATSNAQLLSVLQSVNETLKNMTVAISELKSTMENSRK